MSEATRVRPSSSSVALVPPPGCTITREGAAAQLARAELLRPAVCRIERSPGHLVLAFDPRADKDALAGFVETERGCCRFLEIDYEARAEGATVGFVADDPAREPVLAEIARLFDFAPAPPTSGETMANPRERRSLVVGAVSLGCLLACLLLPGLLAGGAVGVGLGALGGGTAAVLGAVALGLALAGIGALALKRRARSARARGGCGC